MKFWDTSALVPLIFDEPASDAMRQLLEEDPDVVVWSLTAVELLSTIARIGRTTKGLDDLVSGVRLEALDLVTRCATVADTDGVRRRAERLVGVHPLAAADALQLAAALVAATDRPETLPFVSLDRQLARSARLEGFPVRTD